MIFRRMFMLMAILLFSAFVLTGGVNAQEIEHPDSPRDVIIKMMTVREDASTILEMTTIPTFLLYGDGRLIVSRIDEDQHVRVFEAKLDEEQIQNLLRYIETEKFDSFNENYLNLTVKDLETTYITVKTSKKTKTIKIYGMRLAAFQKMVPRGLVNIWRRLSEFSTQDEGEYKPEKVSLYVYEHMGEIPEDASLERWRIKEMDLSKYAYDDKSLLIRYRETVLTGKDLENVVRFLKGKTLFDNRAGFYRILFQDKGRAYKVAYRPHMPYE